MTNVELARHDNSLRRQIAAKVPVRDVSDLVQDVWVAIVEKLADLTDSKQVGGFNYGVAKNVIAGYYRQADSETLSLELVDYGLASSEPDDSKLEYDIEAGMAALEDELQEILALHYWLCLSYKNIAVILGCSKGHIVTRHRTALRRLEGYFIRERLVDSLSLRQLPEECPEQYKEVIIRHYVDNESFNSIAKSKEVGYECIRRRCNKGIEWLQIYYQNQEERP